MSTMAKRELGLSFRPYYLSIEDKLATQHSVPCKTEVDLHGFGYLEPSLNEEHLPKDTLLSLPIWAAEILAKPSRKFVSAEIPKHYYGYSWGIELSDPTRANLFNTGPFFYQTGMYIARLVDEPADLDENLITLFESRTNSLSKEYTARTHLNDDKTSTKKKLLPVNNMDFVEVNIFRHSRKLFDDVRVWRTKGKIR